MKFELFGRLRDHEDSSQSSSSSDNGFERGPNTSQRMENSSNSMNGSMGAGLEDTVRQMSSQGYSEDEIRSELQGQYDQREIENAMNRAITSSATQKNSDGPEPMTPYQGGNEAVSPVDEGFTPQDSQNDSMNQNYNENPSQDFNNDFDDQASQQDIQEMNSQLNDMQQPRNPQNSGNGASEDIEALIETIVAENFQMVEEEFENLYTEIDNIRDQLEELDQRVHDLEVRDDEDQTQFVQKMDELEENINNYQSRIGGLEKAFQQVLPSLVDNVRELTGLVQEMKQEKGIETESSVSKKDIDDIDFDEWD